MIDGRFGPLENARFLIACVLGRWTPRKPAVVSAS